MEAKIYAEVKELGAAELKGDGTLTWDFFLTLNRMTIKFVKDITKDGMDEYTKKRRECLKEDKLDEYEELCID